LAEAIEKARTDGCSLLVHLGDFVDYDDDTEYRYFLKRIRLEAMGLPIFLVRGNHETMSPDGGFSDVYLDHVRRPYYSFEYGGCLFCMLDNSSGALPAGQVSDCRSALAAFRSGSPDGHVFLFAHMPPWYEGAPF
jgi:3',5'-cyclic AMP phosphodiesterase CpdA